MHPIKLLIFAFASLLFQACETSDGLHLNNDDNTELKKISTVYTEAFNQRDLAKIASFWAKDAFYINLTSHESFEGTEEITDYFQREFEKNGADKLHITISTIYFPSVNEAIVKGLMEMDYSNQPPKKSAFLAQSMKENNKWVIQSITVNEINSSLSHFEHLKDLAWLEGNWEDQDDNIDVKYSYSWDKNKNFLTQHFTVYILGQEQISGFQIIGWDPIKKKIRSWIYDSDGGVGKSVWSKEGSTWYVSVVFTLPQGGVASATHIYHKMDDTSYTFASENRDVDGKLLPNIGPFKVIKIGNVGIKNEF